MERWIKMELKAQSNRCRSHSKLISYICSTCNLDGWNEMKWERTHTYTQIIDKLRLNLVARAFVCVCVRVALFVSISTSLIYFIQFNEHSHAWISISPLFIYSVNHKRMLTHDVIVNVVWLNSCSMAWCYRKTKYCTQLAICKSHWIQITRADGIQFIYTTQHHHSK